MLKLMEHVHVGGPHRIMTDLACDFSLDCCYHLEIGHILEPILGFGLDISVTHNTTLVYLITEFCVFR